MLSFEPSDKAKYMTVDFTGDDHGDSPYPWYWPITTNEDWCGEWAHKEGK